MLARVTDAGKYILTYVLERRSIRVMEQARIYLYVTQTKIVTIRQHQEKQKKRQRKCIKIQIHSEYITSNKNQLKQFISRQR